MGVYVVVTAASLTVTVMRRTPLKSHWLVRLDSFSSVEVMFVQSNDCIMINQRVIEKSSMGMSHRSYMF